MRKGDILPLRRRREEQTNYKRRLALVKSGMPRIVTRISNANVILQLVSYEGSDKTTLAFISRKLSTLGWKHSNKNTPACYLSGLLFGYMCKKNKVKGAVFDLGLAKTTAGNRYFAVLKGLADSGLEIPCSDDKMPSEDRITGKHTSKEVQKNFKQVKQKILDDYAK